MNLNEKKIYIRANELYKEGKTAEAIKLWASINQSKKSIIDIEPLIWKLKSISYFKELQISVFAFYSFIILFSFFFGKTAFIIFACIKDLISFKSFPELYNFLSNLSMEEQLMGKMVNDPLSIAPLYERYMLAMQQYYVGKVIHLQSFYFTGNDQISLDAPISSLFFNFSFGLTIGLIALGIVIDFYLIWKVLKGLTFWLIGLLNQKEYWLRLGLATIMAFICFSFSILVLKKFQKPPEVVSLAMLESSNRGGTGEDIGPDENQDSSGGENSQEEKYKSDKSERKFLEDFTSELSRKPYTLKERAAITKMYNDYVKMLRKYGIKGDGSAEQPSVEEIIESMKNGKFADLENKLKKIKAMNEYKRMQGENGEGEGNILTEEDREFSDVIKKSFKTSDKNTLEEFLKTSKELEELYGKSIKNRVFSGPKQKELIKKFKEDPQKAREFAREETNKILERESAKEPAFVGALSMDIMTRINSIINYLECGGDIKVFNQMRVQFLKDFNDPEIRFQFAMRIDFVMASWNEHQSKYFWQMNRALTMEIVDMMIEAAKGVDFDIRKTHLGWFYLVAGYYEKAREECLKSVELEEAEGFTESEGTYVNRSNAALAALMLNQGKTAYIEYNWIYQKVIVKKGYYRNKREDLFAEYIREITAALASPSPCKEAYLCRSMFLEDVNDDLALDDLMKYLALSPDDEFLLRAANLKIKLIKMRLEKRKIK